MSNGVNKLIIPIIVAVIIVAGISAYFIFQKPVLPQPLIGKCGDGICDEFEKANPNLCPKDCQQEKSEGAQPFIPISIPTSQEQINKDSPFAIQGVKVFPEPLDSPLPPGFDDYGDISKLGAKWIRHSGFEGLVRDGIEKELGKYDWNKTDYIFEQTYKQGIHMVITVDAYNHLDMAEHGFLPTNIERHLAFLKAAVERYDGDGINDSPGSPIVDVWQIENEVDGGFFWKDTPENYAKLLKESYKAIKQVNPKAKIAIAGVTTPPGFYEFYVRVFDELAKDKTQYFDILDFHWYPFDVGQYNYLTLSSSQTKFYLKEYIKNIKQVLSDYDYDDIPIFITEFAQYSDTPAHNTVLEPIAHIFHSEKKQAFDLLKQYVYSLCNGVKKIFWGSLTESHNSDETTPNGLFDNVGLINNPLNDNQSHKKLSYYTYKKMVEVLEGSDWNNIQTIQESEGIYIYKFTKQGKSIWVAWNDNNQTKEITISGITSSQVKITEAVPKYKSGKDVENYDTAFETKTKSVQNNKISITLGDVPVFVEEK